MTKQRVLIGAELTKENSQFRLHPGDALAGAVEVLLPSPLNDLPWQTAALATADTKAVFSALANRLRFQSLIGVPKQVFAATQSVESREADCYQPVVPCAVTPIEKIGSLLAKGRESAEGRGKAKCRLKRGGWPPSPRLSWMDVRSIDGIAHDLGALGRGFTHLITVMPILAPSTAPIARKRACQVAIAHFGEALKRRGLLHVGLTIFEHPTSADLHAHHLASISGAGTTLLRRLARPPEIHVAPIRNLNDTLCYVTKERRKLSPDFESRIRRRWSRCRVVPGKRWSVTKEAKRLLAKQGGGIYS